MFIGPHDPSTTAIHALPHDPFPLSKVGSMTFNQQGLSKVTGWHNDNMYVIMLHLRLSHPFSGLSPRLVGVKSSHRKELQVASRS